MRRLRTLYPNSFLKLLLIGFALTMLPLLFAFANAALYLDRLAEQSRKTVYQAVEATRSSRMLTEQLTTMERSVRQYLVLGDASLLENYGIAHQKFLSTVQELSKLPLDDTLRIQLRKVSAQEERLSAAIVAGPTQADAPVIVGQFYELSGLAKDILDANNQLIDRESSILAAEAERAQNMLLWQTLPLVPVTVLVAVAIAFLLSRPIRRMEAAIRKLGRGEYQDPIVIDGPGDLRHLGERLDWLRQQLNDLEEQKKRFLRNVSHELKTPLTSIREGSELLSEEVGGALSPQHREIAAILRENGLRLQRMIENLLNYTAVEFQKPVLTLETLACKPLVEQALAAYRLTIDAKQIQIATALAEASIEADREKVVTVIDNLVSNAIKYTPKGGSITLRLQHGQTGVTLEVADSGPGIMPEEREHLFEPFYRGSGNYESHITGSGLGLSIAREYVEAHGGQIQLVPSERGAVFRVTLPYRQGTPS